MTNACNVKIDGGAAHDPGSVKEEVLEGRYSAHLSIIVPAKEKDWEECGLGLRYGCQNMKKANSSF